MLNNLAIALQLLKTLGLRYFLFRIYYAFMCKSGMMKYRYPCCKSYAVDFDLHKWKKSANKFFFESKEDLAIPKDPTTALKNKAEKILNGEFEFFNSMYFKLGSDYDWVTNPVTGYIYDISKHWSEIDDFNNEAGDIKYVWEMSRFSFVYPIIRYDYHFDVDCSKYIFEKINDWINKNPLNSGPNYKCSQEISLRILNWIFVLYYYRNSTSLTQQLFNKIVNSIYYQTLHVYKNINFSRIAVRNNHALTETLTLYIVNLLFDFFPNASKMKKKGKSWFEQEITYQIYPDGSYLQFSTNYHRVVIQLLTWALYLAEKNNDFFNASVYERSKKSLEFLFNLQDKFTGNLPNYGANDGALFFNLTNADFRDYRPQLNALYFYFNKSNLYQQNIGEDVSWYLGSTPIQKYKSEQHKHLTAFNIGGIYSIRDDDSFTMVKCSKYKDRPSHADNLHLDIWVKGVNVLRDAGSYMYNTTDELQKYFFGTRSHNTVMLDNYDQMLKGPRFTWFHWTQAEFAKVYARENTFFFEGQIKAFNYLSRNIRHYRKVIKQKNSLKWIVFDEVNGTSKYNMRQIWNVADLNMVDFLVQDSKENYLQGIVQDKWYSGHYGVKEPGKQVVFETGGNWIRTTIELKTEIINKHQLVKPHIHEYIINTPVFS